MSPRSLVVAPVFALIIACGGGVDRADNASSGSGRDDDAGAGGCTTSAINGKRACVPGIAAANQPLELVMDDPEGCTGCHTTLNPCEVSVAGETITLSLSAKTCTPPGDLACPAVCGIPSAKCTVPPLAAGKYIVEIEGDRRRDRPRELVVGPNPSPASSCTLTQVGTTIPSLDVAKYEGACSVDDDCAPAMSGALCGACGPCPTTAIPKTNLTKYEAELRAATSQCATPQQQVACAACPPMNTKCDPTTKRCKLEPKS